AAVWVGAYCRPFLSPRWVRSPVCGRSIVGSLSETCRGFSRRGPARASLTGSYRGRMSPVGLPRALLAKERKYRSFRMESTGRNLANHPRRSMVQPLGAVLFIALAALSPPTALAGTPVAVATYEGVINPVSAEY